MPSVKQLPLLDIRTFPSDPKKFVKELRHACHHVGFFFLKHDLPPRLGARQLDEARSFFRRDEKQKMEISYEQSSSFRGYMKLGSENTAGVVDLREQIEYAAEYDVDMNEPAWPPYLRLRGKNPWPTCQPSLRKTTLEYSKHVCRIADSLRQALSLAIELDVHSLDKIFQEPHWVIKLVSYPSMLNIEPALSNALGVGPHTDTNFLTLILQDDVGGLQVFSHGEWIDVETDLGSDVLVCNLGEQAEILSNGYFKATPHRVLANTNAANKERISIPLFFNPNLSATIRPVATQKSLVWERPKDENKTWRMTDNTMMASVGENTFKSLARSHPKTFQKFHSDLEISVDGRITRRHIH